MNRRQRGLRTQRRRPREGYAHEESSLSEAAASSVRSSSTCCASAGHEVVAASPNTGVNTLTGEGLAEALAGADVVVDVANSPSFEDKAVMDFFHVGPQPARGREGGGREASRGAVGCRHAARRRQRLPAGQGGAGEPHQGVVHPVHDPAIDAVLRVHRTDRQRRRSTATSIACRRR